MPASGRNLLHVTDAQLLCRGRPIAYAVTWASRPADRMRGLLGGRPLSEGQALVIVGARQIHTFGMRYAIDVLFCDAGWVVRHRIDRLAPRRITRWVNPARCAIELPGGAMGDVRTGERLEWEPWPPSILSDLMVLRR